MRWALFQQVFFKLARIRALDPDRDATAYADVLLAERPELFAELAEGAEGTVARMAARTIARDHLREVCRLPVYVEDLERSLSVATMSASARLVRLWALAYLLVDHDLHRDDRFAGYGLIDDCICVRAAVLATPGALLGRRTLGAQLAGELLRIRYLGVGLPPDLLPGAQQALTHAAELAAQTSELPDHVLEFATRELIQNPPTELPAKLPLPEAAEPHTVESVLQLLPGQLRRAEGETLVLRFADGSQLRREAGGELHDDG
jgi:hypothetical protein